MEQLINNELFKLTESKRQELWEKHAKLAVVDAYGIYCPVTFLERFPELEGIGAEDRSTIEKGPDEEWYWDAWGAVLNNGSVTLAGVNYSVYQDGDVWLIDWDKISGEWESFCEEHGITEDLL